MEWRALQNPQIMYFRLNNIEINTRMKKFLLPVSVLLVIFVTGCQSSADNSAGPITEEALLNHIEILSSDEFEGRAPATRGEDLTADYLVTRLEEMGINPGMPDGTYIQEFPLLGQRVDGESAGFIFRKEGRAVLEPEYSTKFMAWPGNEAEKIDVRNAEMMYVGYGIQAPEFGWDDYKDADVEGKVLVYKNSDPSYDPDLFGGTSRLYYGRWSYKFEKAAEMGALGAVIIHTTLTAGYPWEVVSNSWGREQFALKSGGEGSGMTEFNAWTTEQSSAALFEEAGLNLEEMLDAADDPEFRPVLLDGVTLDVNLTAEYSNMSSRNILGYIEGSDPELADEAVVFTAHYDHLGITSPVNADSINNGAADNAAGVSSVLVMANALKQAEDQMRRSALFLFVGAEEMGLLGSQNWAANPTVHPGKVSANINLDGMQVYGETRDVVLVGYGRNTLTDVIRNYAEEEGREVVPDPNPEQGFFYRSDHFSLAKAGIPAVFPNPGRDYIGKPGNWNAVVDSVTAANYHAVSDEINEYWDLTGMERDVRLFFRAALHILSAEEMMEWVSGDEFEATRKQMLEQAEDP